jgi:hypothetical protein
MKPVPIYVNTSAEVGDADHRGGRRKLVRENDAEGVAFEYDVLE